MFDNGTQPMTVNASDYDLQPMERQGQQPAPATPAAPAQPAAPSDDDGEGAQQQAPETPATPAEPKPAEVQFNEAEYLKEFEVESKEQLKEALEER